MEAIDLQELPVNFLQSNPQSDLLDRIAELRKLGFNRRVLLPQIVICGDQNGGKSSVFEAITGIALPINDGVCTRFATEVILKRSPSVSTNVKIRPSANATPHRRQKLGAFARSHNWLKDAAKLFSEARLIMGLMQDGEYSPDVLQLEVSGPTLPDMTVVDLPGLLHSPNSNQTPEDVDTARLLTESYMNNPRSIVLAVISAEYPLSQQVVLQTISACAPRTMGILTKADLLEPESPGEEVFYNRLKNQDAPLRLGWHMLKNPDTSEKRFKEVTRDDSEAMFLSTTAPWKDVHPKVLGIDSLRSRLSKVILSEAELQLTTLASGIQKDIEANRTSLERLGPCRATGIDRRLFLSQIADRCTSLTKAATLGEYNDTYFSGQPSYSIRRLRSVLRSWAENFAADMEARGHTYNILDNNSPDEPHRPPRPTLSPEDPQPIARTELISGLAELLRKNRLRDQSGLLNAHVVGELFSQYSNKWGSMAKAHVFEVWKKAKLFLDDLFQAVAGGSVGGIIARELVNHEMERKLQKLNQKIEELTRPYKKVIPATLSRDVNMRIKELRQKRAELHVEEEDGSYENEYSLCSELLDCMLSYYNVALGVFIDNVANLAVENCLVDGLEDLISPSQVSQMSDAEIERLTVDSEDVELARQQATRRIKVLEKAMISCTKCELNALESATQNYRFIPTKDDSNPSNFNPTRNSSDASISPSLSPTSSSDTSPPPISRVKPKSPKLTKARPSTPALRTFPPPTRPPVNALPPPPPLNNPPDSPNRGNPPCTSPPMLPKAPPTPPVPMRSLSRSQSVTSDGGQREGNGDSKFMKGHRKRISKIKQPVVALLDQKTAPYPPVATFGVYSHIYLELTTLVNHRVAKPLCPNQDSR